MKKLIVKADTNDGDYITAVNEITEEEFYLISEVIDAIKQFKPYEEIRFDISWKHESNYPIGECHRSDLGEKSVEEMYGHLKGFKLFNDKFVPYNEYGIHTIKSIELINESKNIL